MYQLHLSFLGAFSARLADRLLEDLGTDKVRALLAYLALEPARNHARGQLAGLLWPGVSDKQARQSLRAALYRLRQTLDKAGTELDPSVSVSEQLLTITHQTVTLNTVSSTLQLLCDVDQFRAHLAAVETHAHVGVAECDDCFANLDVAASFYQAELLAGFGLADAPAFEEWLLLQREMLHQQALLAFERLATIHEARGNFEQAATLGTRLLVLDPYRETSHRRVMQLLALRGLPNQALAQFANCRQLMMDEFGAEPEAETVALAERIRRGELEGMTRWQDDKVMDSSSHPVIPSSSHLVKNRHDWHEMPIGSRFFGRQEEMAQLEMWLVTERCRLVSLLAIGGMGKTSLAAEVVPIIADHFDLVIWRSLLNAPPLEELLETILPVLSNQQIGSLPDSLEKQLQLLFHYLHDQRALLVLDNLESILQAGAAGQFHAGYEGYGQLLQRMATQQHRGQILLTSRERPAGIKRLERDTPQVRSLHLRGLDESAGNQLLVSRGLSGTTEEEVALTERYSGNPLALKLVADTVQDLFFGDIQEFLAEDSLIFDDVRRVLDQHFERLTILEQEILFWLAIERASVDVSTLREKLLHAPPGRSLLEALNSLQRRSLIERQADGFTLQNVIAEYLTERFVEAAVQELVDGQLYRLHRHALLNVQAREFVRQSQIRLILHPIAKQINAQFSGVRLKMHVQQLLDELRMEERGGPSYAGGNLLNLLLHLQDESTDSKPSGYDFSNLPIRQAFLRGMTLHGYNFAGADFRSSVFTETFGAIWALTVQPNGPLLAVGTLLGPIYLYHVDDARPLGVLWGHQAHVLSLAFSADGKTLVSGSVDHTIAMWDVSTTGDAATTQAGDSPLQPTQLLRGHESWVYAVAFSPDGKTIASASVDQTVRLWDSQTGEEQTVLGGGNGRVYSVAFSPDGRTLASGSEDRKIYLWDTQTGRRWDTLSYPTESSAGTFGQHVIAFSPDGQTLASSSPEYTLLLWSMDERAADYGQVRAICRGHSDWISELVFNPCGDTLASTGFDGTVRLWDVATGNAHYVLSGHINTLNAGTFSPDGRTFISGGSDETVRFWDVETGQPRQILQGYTNHSAEVAFSPDGNLLATANADNTVRLWNLQTLDAYQAGAEQAGTEQNKLAQMPLRLLGHTDKVMAVAFHPDGGMLASGGHDQTILFWDREAAKPIRKLQGHTKCVRDLAFTPDGKTLASGSYDLTARLWNVQTGQVRHTLQAHKDWILSLAISPDGRTLATASDTVRLWDIETGTLLQAFPEQSSMVYDVAFSPDGQIVLAGYLEEAVCLWDVQTGQQLDDLNGHSGFVNFVMISPDRQTMVSGDAGHQIHLWQVQSCDAPLRLPHVSTSVIKVAYSPDSQFIVSGGDETIKLWSSDTGECLKTLHIPGPYHGMNITGVTGINRAQKEAFKALGAVDSS